MTFICAYQLVRDKWVPVTTAWRVLGLRVGERPPIRRKAVNILNKQSRTADKGWFPALGLGEVLTTPRRKQLRCCKTFHKASDLNGIDLTQDRNRCRALVNAVMSFRVQ